jgi:hypothetical protein
MHAKEQLTGVDRLEELHELLLRHVLGVGLRAEYHAHELVRVELAILIEVERRPGRGLVRIGTAAAAAAARRGAKHAFLLQRAELAPQLWVRLDDPARNHPGTRCQRRAGPARRLTAGEARTDHAAGRHRRCRHSPLPPPPSSLPILARALTSWLLPTPPAKSSFAGSLRLSAPP